MAQDNFNTGSDTSSSVGADAYLSKAETHKQSLKSFWKTFGKTGAFVVAAIVVIALLVFAWFVSNMRVASTTSTISADYKNVKLATKGQRQNAEVDYLKPQMADGTEMVFDGETYYVVSGGGIALRFSENYLVTPGARGEMTFYIVPDSSGAQSYPLFFNVNGYRLETEGEDSKAVPANDVVLSELLAGHFLLFKTRSADGFYSDWLQPTASGSHSLVVTLPETAEAGKPYPCTIYWIWPKRYTNLVSHRVNEGDVTEEGAATADDLLAFVNAQAESRTAVPGVSGYYYSKLFVFGENVDMNADSNRKNAYNLADEYIGANSDYLFISITTSESTQTEEGGA